MAAQPNDRPANAALAYWQAFGEMPDLINTKLRDRIWDATTFQGIVRPVDDELARFVGMRGSAHSLEMLHRAANMQLCDWQLPLEEDGINVLLPHTSKARHMMRLSLLRARHRFEHDQVAGGITDVVDTMALGRHITADGVTISQLAGYSIEHVAIFVLAAYLPEIPDDLLRTIPKQLDSLPPLAPMHQTLVNEQYYLDWFLGQLQKATPESRQELCRLLAGSDKEGDRLSEADLPKLGQELRGLYEKIPEMAALPTDELQAACDRRVKPTLKRNPLANVLFPSVPAAITAERMHGCRQQLLRAAIGICLEGNGALAGYRDPFGDGPFEMATFDGGFELRSQHEYAKNHRLMVRAGIRRK